MNALPHVTVAPYYFAITIPGNGTVAGATIQSFIDAAFAGTNTQRVAKIVKISAAIPGEAGTARGAVVTANARATVGGNPVATDFTSHGKYWASGVEVYEQSDAFDTISIRSATAGSVPALLTIL